MATQDSTPYLDALRAYADRHPGRFHVPGHKGGPAADARMTEAFGERALAMDVPALTQGIDAGPPPTPFQQAQTMAAQAWGAQRTWFLINGSSQGNHAVCLSLAQYGEAVVVQRNVHSSTVDGLILSGLRPTFAAPELDPDLGVAHCLTPESLREALSRTPNAAGAIAVSPTYFGAVADVRRLADIAHEHGVPLVIDQAWGAHLAFHEELPEDALACGADLVVSSTHKMIGSFTQSAMLHLASSGAARLDENVVDRAVTLIESTSPSSLLLGSLDAARRFAAVDGRELLSETMVGLRNTRAAIRELPGLDVLDERLTERPGVHAYDPLRLAIDVRSLGISGYEIADMMRESDDINLELASEHVIMAVFGVGEVASDYGAQLVHALERAIEAVDSQERPAARPFSPPPPWGPLQMTPREAFLGAQEVVPFADAVGRIASESLAAYPPGIPNVLPGEQLTEETFAYVQEMMAQGGYLRGASDRSLRTARVAVEAR
ncbi:MAG: aminotransferase class V-fold PLP-dependent enzyme [Solirubrobacterales bacterium]